MKKIILTVIIIWLIPSTYLHSQTENWDVYMATYEKGPGSTLLNMSLKTVAPIKDFYYILITGVTFPKCNADGLPMPEQFPTLYAISDSVQSILSRNYTFLLAGTFTYQCQRLDYYYLKDTTGTRELLNNLYSNKFKDYNPYINLKEDKSWDSYLTFLYPSEEILEYMGDQKVVLSLQNAGDKLEKPRQVDHWIYFNSESDLRCFLSFVKKNGFKIETNEKVTGSTQIKYKLQISRVDSVSLNAISAITLSLRVEAKKCNGDYDGWETFVIK